MEKLKRNKKFLLGFCALIVAVAMVSIGVTLALLRKESDEVNVITIGNVDIDLYDNFPDQGKTKTPGDTAIPKVIRVDNTGNLPCYVRLKVKKQWKEDTTLPTDVIELDIPTDNDWVKGTGPDAGYDYYYYQTALAPEGQTGSQSKEFIKQFYFREDATPSQYNGKTGQIFVQAEAIQADFVEDKLVKNSEDKIVGWTGITIVD